ncbi:transcription initiation factor TFIID subunit 2, partial [Phenoliferia sp. Uapishka_3]
RRERKDEPAVQFGAVALRSHEEMPLTKGYLVSHQKVSINVALNGKISGFTELTIIPTAPDLKVIWLHARDLNIISASLRIPTNIPLDFSHLPPAPPGLTEPTNIHTYPELKRAVWRATSEGEEGELGIGIPSGSVTKANSAVAVVAATPKEEKKGDDEWEPIVVSIEYEVVKPGAGIVVVRPDDANPSRFPHVFTSAASDIAARTWIPCSDYARDRCTWDLEIIVPRVLYAGSSRRAAASTEDDPDFFSNEDEQEEEWPISVACSGELVEQVTHPDRSDRVIWHYSQATPVSVHHIAWAVGPFVISEILGKPKDVRREVVEDENEEEEDQVKDDGPKLHALCLPGREAEMAHSVAVIRQAMDFYTSTFGSYPFSTYTVAFVDSLSAGSPTFHSAAFTLFSSDMLHPPNIIDQAYETRHLLAHALATQWSGVNLIPKTPSDVWLTTGIALHITSLFIRALWGNNEYRFRLKKDVIRCANTDVQREPISVPTRHTQPEPEQLQFIALKAPLVLHILDKHLRKSGTSLGLDKVLPKLFLDAITGDLGSGANFNTIHTNGFMRTCRKACGGSGESLKSFFDQWVYGSGCPTFLISAMFNRKKMAVELKIEQKCLAYNWAQNAPWEESGHLRPIPLFEGQMTIRIHEADGTPYEHVLNIQDAYKRHEVPFNTKYKRIRRNTKRYQARQAAATAAASGDVEAQEDVAMMDVGFNLALWEDETEREKWRVADWTEEDDAVMSQATYEWIRIDADLEWICNVQFEQQDFMWLSQLQRDRDIVAQLEAVHALSRQPSAIISANLTRTILVTDYFFRVRMEAALALVTSATEKMDFIGLFHLFKLFQSQYCFEPDVETQDPSAFRCIPKTNNFEQLTEYFLKKTIVKAISMVRDQEGQTPPVVQQFLVDLLAYNDNLGNLYSDTFYIAEVMNALAHSFVAVASKEAGHLTEETYEEAQNNEYLQPAIQEVERYMSTDRLVPSYHNAITIAGIEFKVKLTMACLMPEDRTKFFVYTRDGNYPPVRIAAFDALLLLNPLQDVLPLVRYFFGVLRNDSSLLVQRRLAQSLLQSLPVLAAIHDLAAPEMVFEEEGAAKKEKDPLSNVLKALRKKPGRSVNYRQQLLQTLIHEGIDPEVQLCLLKLCESTVRAAGEPLMKVRIPARAPTLVAEPPAPTPVSTFPKIKLTTSQGPSSLPPITLSRRSSSAVPPPVPVVPERERERFEEVQDAPYVEEPAYYEPAPLPPPPSPPKKLKIKAQAPPRTGMSGSDVAACRSILKKLLKDKYSLMFRAPVDPVKSGAPGYFDVIQYPMDLSTMSAKLQAGQYADRSAFRADFKLVISNARLYNVAGIVVEQADRIDAVFNKAWDRMEATLLGMAGPTAHVPAPIPAHVPIPAAEAPPKPPGPKIVPKILKVPRYLPPPREPVQQDPV